jgi:hypothetical protein
MRLSLGDRRYLRILFDGVTSPEARSNNGTYPPLTPLIQSIGLALERRSHEESEICEAIAGFPAHHNADGIWSLAWCLWLRLIN